MKLRIGAFTLAAGLVLSLLAHSRAEAQQYGAVYTQCPGDADGNSIPDVQEDTDPTNDGNVRCLHLSGGDGFVTMADGRPLYMFGFSNLTGTPADQAMDTGALAANFPAPTIVLDEGDHFYLNLTNVGMTLRPDLSDPHSVHFHGFPNAAPIFDGTPENSIAVNMGSTLTYYYKLVEPGTYMYHCHVEATEHMQMGMLGNLYVRPRQNRCSTAGNPACPAGLPAGTRFAYNDGDGSTRYDVEYPIQIGSFDPEFHDASENVQPLPFAAMKDRYAMLNGRGYPDTVNPGPISTPTDRNCAPGSPCQPSQPVSSLIEATTGQRILLRISNLSVTRFYTLASTIPMEVVGHSARLHRGPSGAPINYKTNSVTLGGGESVDVILETGGATGVEAGTYLLYTTNLNYLSNDGQDLGGMMTEIRISGGGV
jgi:FtsP/CotA-like multicopper oxidase with cupredoxin domain